MLFFFPFFPFKPCNLCTLPTPAARLAGCATVAEMRKRGDDFWSEFEFYLSDLLVGLVLDVVLVTLIAPVARPGRPTKGECGRGRGQGG